MEQALENELPAGSDPVASVDPAALRQRVLRLAWPIIGENLLETLLGIVDTWLVAGLGMAAIAGVGAGQQLMMFLLAALSALSVGTSILVAQAVGAKNLERAGSLARQSLVWSGVFSVPLAILGVTLAHQIIRVFGNEPEVARIGAGYFQVTMGTVVVVIALIIGGGVLRGAGDSRTPMKVTAVANVVNAILAYGLIYGKWGLPQMGAVGSAWATFLARALALALMLRVLWVGRNGVRISGLGSWRPDWTLARQVLTLGLPFALEQILNSTAFLFMTILVAHLGTDTFAAQRISMTALSFSFMPGIGFSIAASALVGQSVGAKRLHEGAVAARVATISAVIWMGAIGLVLLCFAEPIMRLFVSDANVVRIGAAGLRVVALLQPFWAVGMVQAGSLRGTGDTRFPMMVSTTGVWTAVGLAWLGIHLVGGGLAMVWGAFLLTSPCTAAIVWRRFQHRVKSLEKQDEVPAGELAVAHG